jgi:hypothetical protein
MDCIPTFSYFWYTQKCLEACVRTQLQRPLKTRSSDNNESWTCHVAIWERFQVTLRHRIVILSNFSHTVQRKIRNWKRLLANWFLKGKALLSQLYLQNKGCTLNIETLIREESGTLSFWSFMSTMPYSTTWRKSFLRSALAHALHRIISLKRFH